MHVHHMDAFILQMKVRRTSSLDARHKSTHTHVTSRNINCRHTDWGVQSKYWWRPGSEDTWPSLPSLLRNELSNSPFPILPSPHSGQLCCARFSQDQCWYRAMIESIPKPGKVCTYVCEGVCIGWNLHISVYVVYCTLWWRLLDCIFNCILL